MMDVSYWGAALAGLLSFFSPCILPIVPFYLSYMAGVGMDALSGEGGVSAAVRRRAVISALCFSAGILTIFMAMGATASVFGQAIAQHMGWLRVVAAVLIGAMGLHFLGVIRIGLLYRQFRVEAGETSNMSFVGAYVVGLAFAFGWTPCVGPILASIFMIAASDAAAATGGMGRGVALLFTYGVGMTAPFVAAALFVGPFLAWMRGFRKHLPKVEKGMGVLLIVFAVLIGTDSVNLIAQWMLDYVPVLG